MKQKLLSNFFAVLIVFLFILNYFPIFENSVVASQAEANWVATPLNISQLANPNNSPQGYSPSQIRIAYGLPSKGGVGFTIAIIDAYDTPSISSDLMIFSNQFNLPPPNRSNFEVAKMSQSVETANSTWMTETCLDVEWAHAIAPDAKILLVEAISSSNIDLLNAVDYARNQPDVASVSMSWGGSEFRRETNYDSYFASNNGIVFFASSGDNGSGAIWPASSPNVVAVGGTTLTFQSGGISETAWSLSGGGISAYETMPSYQTSYGLDTLFNTTKRSIPDVSYNGNPSTGVAVYCNSQWYVVGGTSAGAPQWAAIYALGHSATNHNLYLKAKFGYSSYFRDIVSGSNGGFSATQGYDRVTGLGSPLTFNFGSLTVSPTSGPGGGLVTLDGIGFIAGSSANMSYLNPINSTWIPITNNFPIGTTQDITYTFKAPDLLQNNQAGDKKPQFNNIIFRAQDNSNGKTYNTSIPYTEWRKGIIQIGNIIPSGIYGNNTDLSSEVFFQNNQLIAIVGEWFNPGDESLLLDGTTDLGTVTTDENGFFNATIKLPPSAVGSHLLTINDRDSNFCVNITRLPMVNNNYDGLWHTSDLTISLTPDYNVTETFYSINNGAVSNVSANGQPIITSESNNNTLEYWSTWDVYGTQTIDLPHVILSGIELQKTPPSGIMQIGDGELSTSLTNVTLTISATDPLSGLSQIRFSNENNTWNQNPWEPYTSTKMWNLTSGDGVKMIYCQIKDTAGLTTTLTDSITLNAQQPSPSQSPVETSSLSATYSPSSTPSSSTTKTSTPSPIGTPLPRTQNSPQSSSAPVIPEFSIQMFIVLLVSVTLLLTITCKKSMLKKTRTH